VIVASCGEGGQRKINFYRTGDFIFMERSFYLQYIKFRQKFSVQVGDDVTVNSLSEVSSGINTT